MFSSRNEGEFRSDALRQEAEQRLRKHQMTDPSHLGAEDLRNLIHELEVHQAELEVQNEELRRTQTQLAEAHKGYEDLYEFAPVGYLTLDSDGRIERANLTAAKLCGVDRRGLVGQRMEKLMAREDRDACYVFLREMAGNRASRSRDLRIRDSEGQTRWVNMTVSALTPAGDKAGGLRVTLSDISECKAAEAALRQSKEQMRELAGSLERRVAERTARLQSLAAQLSQAEQRERHRLAKILHDHLQQLLVGAKYSLDILRRQAVDEDQEQLVQRVDDLLDESVTTSRSLTAEMSPPILYEGTMRQVLEWLAQWMRDTHGLSVHLAVDEEANVQEEDFRVLIFGIVRELLLNTVKHAGVSAAAVRMTRADGDRVQVVVEDDGAGFDPNNMQPDEAGGFGLFGIRQRLAALAGRIEIDSAPDHGTRITLIVPADLQTAVTADAVLPERPDRKTHVTGQAVDTTETPARETIRVLLADDHTVVRDGLAKLLQLQPGIDVVGRAADGIEARDMAFRLRPDVVVMDVSMPGLSGMDATRQILAERPGTCVIGLSMHTERDIATAMRESGAVGYLAKSTPPEALIAEIRRCAKAPA